MNTRESPDRPEPKSETDQRKAGKMGALTQRPSTDATDVARKPGPVPAIQAIPASIARRDVRAADMRFLSTGASDGDPVRTMARQGASHALDASNESIGVGDGLFEPVPLKEDRLSDDGSIHSKKRAYRDTSKLVGLRSYASSLDDPFSPRPIVQTENQGLTFVDEETMEKFNLSLSSIDTSIEDDPDQTDATDTYNNTNQQPKRPRAAHKLPPKYQSIRQTRSEEKDAKAAGLEETLSPTYHARMPSSNSKSDSSSSPPSRLLEVPSEGNDRLQDQEQTRDASSVMARLDQLMFKSEMTQAALQYYDKRRGLPRSHCQTMVNSSRSRKQLLEGKIIKKWNGRPLLGDEEALSIASEGGPRRHRQRRKSKTETLPSAEKKEDDVEEQALSENVSKDEKPKRRMSAPPSCPSESGDN
eukprot:CAMPEP_0194051856 /NCGR_PEP_ID=MMETSP0009_2-20130614/42717_1 /TAXON_ID=210454 /ORGANISM="Grammatophora oceanica, Strain CCMP 410" /LENGTH=415 /DNA_ID=CAMNT_0038699149 /DNA_START=18 /DNA_END=1265 /DNA_ORIENTATION=-